MTSACPRHAVPVLDAGSERSAAERSKRRRELGRLDAVRLLVAAIVVIDTLGSMTTGGAQTLTWLATLTVLTSCPPGWSSPTPTPTGSTALPATALASCSPSSSHWPRGRCRAGGNGHGSERRGVNLGHCPTAQPREE